MPIFQVAFLVGVLLFFCFSTAKVNSETEGKIQQLNKELSQVKQDLAKLNNAKVEVKGTATVERPVVQQPPRPKPVEPVRSSGSIVDIAKEITVSFFGEAHWNAMHTLIMKESGYNPNARNPSSGACGIPQALPCSKMPDKSVRGQLTWMNQYIKNRYGNPTNALNFHLQRGWY